MAGAAHIFILGLLVACAKAQSISDAATLQEACEMAARDYKMVGVATSSFDDTESTISTGHAGERIKGEGTPIEQADQWIMGSNTKSMVATVAARVVEQGLINWTSTAKEMFQDTGLFEINEGYHGSTLELFLSHGSGAPGLGPVQADFVDMIDYIFNATSWQPGYDNRPARIFMSKRLLQEKPYQTVGQFEYSIGGFTVAGCMLEVATGKTFEELTQELLFDPLGMDGCGFGPTTTEASIPPVAPWGHLADIFSYKQIPTTPSIYANVASPMVPDGGIKCNLESWQKYLVAHMTQDESLLSKDTWEYIQTPLVDGYFGQYGYGWIFDFSQALLGKIMTHGGTDGHNFANCLLIPRFKFGANIGLNDPKVEGSRSTLAYNDLILYMATHMLGKEMPANSQELHAGLANHVLDVLTKAEKITSIHL